MEVNTAAFRHISSLPDVNNPLWPSRTTSVLKI
jgi:hypothetical protein